MAENDDRDDRDDKDEKEETAQPEGEAASDSESANAEKADAKADEAGGEASSDESDEAKSPAADEPEEETAESSEDTQEDSESKDEEDEPERDEDDSEDAGSDDAKAPSVEAEGAPKRRAAAWGRPLVRLDTAWTKWEVWLCATTILLEVSVLSLWVGLRGLSTAADGSSKAGLVFRAGTGAIVLAVVAWLALKKANPIARRVATIGAGFAGLFLAKTWGSVGVDWASNMLNWVQQASSLTLWGGLRGVGTRLTLLLALLGGSLATAAGKHITIDLLTRYLRPKQRLPAVVVGWFSASLIIGAASWGFFDHIAIDDFDATADMSAGQKISQVTHGLDERFFVARKQLVLDVKSIPHVLKGERYSEYLTGTEWNKWVDEHGFAEHYGKEKAEILKVPDDLHRAPIVVVPEKGEPRGVLQKSADLIAPIGLLVISLRFILLALLALSGHRSVDTESHGDMNVIPGGKTDKHIKEEPEEGKA